MKALVRMRVTPPLTPVITISCWTNPGEPQTTPPRMFLVTIVSSGRAGTVSFYRGKPIQMPERCVRKEMCGTHAPLWLVGGHPRIRDGVGHPKGVWKLEKQLLFVQISSHSSESV